jgi:hypothetical protein
MKDLSEKEDAGEPLYADSAYSNESIEIFCKRIGVESRIHKKEYRNKPLQKSRKTPTRKCHRLGRGWNTSSHS